MSAACEINVEFKRAISIDPPGGMMILVVVGESGCLEKASVGAIRMRANATIRRNATTVFFC